MIIEVKSKDEVYVMDDDGIFRCQHLNIEYEEGEWNDGANDMPGGWYDAGGFYCPDCNNEDVTDEQLTELYEAFEEPSEW